jgi:haloacetate dehalogenase
MTHFFPGFEPLRIDTGEVVINGVTGGNGPPLLLVHGWPQTHLIWRLLAPKLAEHFTVVATDLRGYGDSGKPADGVNHEGHSKRAMARDQVAVMRALGHERFALVGHDRGARVAHRIALDHPESLSRAVLLDIVPTHTLYANMSKALGLAYFHWLLLPQPAPLPETLLGNSIETFLRAGVFRGLVPQVIGEAVFAEYLRCAADPATLHAMCEDYRAGATIDLEHDAADLQRRIDCPLLVLWGIQGAMHKLFDVLGTWQDKANDVRGKALPGGHWMPEQCPDELFEELMAFLLSKRS